MDSTSSAVNFMVGFNDFDLSDRVLRLEITPSFSSIGDDSGHDLEDFGSSFKVKTFNICSLLLAVKSPFFYKLFKNGMRESHKKDEFSLRINASEEAAFMDMLNSIYDKPLNATSRAELLDVLMVADKFEVTSCTRQCVQLLLKLPMTRDSAITYLELPSEVLAGEVTRPLIGAANRHLSSRFSGFTESQQEKAMSLPLCAVEAVLGSANLQVKSEEAVLDFILKWGRRHYPKLEERREILTKHLLGFVCFPCLSSFKLKEVVDNCTDFEPEQLLRLAFNALVYKIELPNGPKSIPVVKETLLPNNALANCSFPKRAYSHRRVIFFDIKKQDCIDMVAVTSRIYSEEFCLGGRCFSLFVQRHKKQESPAEHFGVFVQMRGSGTCSLGCEFSVMKKPSKEFQSQVTYYNTTLTEAVRGKGASNLFGMPWTDLMSRGRPT